jgi:tetratricopeptide (TPR) repeat protein
MRFPSLPHGSTVRYWLIPALTEVGFQGPRALRVWYADSTLAWEPFMGASSMNARTDVLVEFDAQESRPATVIEPEAFALFAEALDAVAADELSSADSLLAACFRAQPIVSEPFFSSLAYTQARVALALGEPARAESLALLDLKWEGESARYHAVRARIAAARGERGAAGKELERALTLEPRNADAIALARELGFISDP